MSEARAAGVYDEGVADLRASSVTLKSHPEAVAADPATGATTTLSQVHELLPRLCLSSLDQLLCIFCSFTEQPLCLKRW